MTAIQPFAGQVIRQEYAHDVVSPAYDAMGPAARARFRHEHPNSYLHVTRSADDEPDAATVDHATLVERGRKSLEQILAQDLFADATEAAYHIYRLADGEHEQLGLVCEIAGRSFAESVKPHEATQPDRAALLAAHMLGVAAASSPVACTMRDSGAFAELLQQAGDSEPIVHIVDADGFEQSVWRVDDPEHVAALEAAVRAQPMVIIDGHHRSAANRQLLDQGTELPVLAVVFPSSSLRLLGFHRLVRLPDGFAPAAFLHRLSRRFTVVEEPMSGTVAAGEVAMALDNRWYRVELDERPLAGHPLITLGSLDPVVLEREVLQSIIAPVGQLDVSYRPATDPFDDILNQAERHGLVPMFVASVDLEDMMTVAEGGLLMPPKSTYFTPKVRAGVFLRRFEI